MVVSKTVVSETFSTGERLQRLRDRLAAKVVEQPRNHIHSIYRDWNRNYGTVMGDYLAAKEALRVRG
jgi:hypothetical protein